MKRQFSRSNFRLLGAAALCAIGMPAPADAQGIGGVNLSLSYTSDLLSNVRGGIKRGTVLLGKADAIAEVDGSVFGVEGASAYFNLQYVHGPAFSERYAGDAQVTSNIEAVSALRPLEAWIDLPLSGDAVRVKAGLVDLNGEFDVQNVGALFLNSSHGIGADFSQSGLNGPSIFPTTSGALVLRGAGSGWTGRLGFFDAVAGDPDRPRRTRLGLPGSKGLLTVAEVERSLGEGSAAKVGAWSYSSRFDALDQFDGAGSPRRIRGNRGIYATVEGRIAARKGRSLDAWLRAGMANARINAIAWTIGGGAAWGDDEGRLGLAFSRAALGDPGRDALVASGERPTAAETNIEVTYSVELRPGVSVQPDLQYVVNPSWRRDIKDALIAGLRLTLAIP